MKPRVMAVMYSFENGGSERMAVAVINHLQAEGYAVDVCATHSTDGVVARQLEAGGLQCFGMDIESRSRLGRRWGLYRLFRKRRVDVLYVQHFPMLVLCYWPARLAGVRRIVVTEHSDIQLRDDPVMVRLARRYVPRADVVTVIHAGLRDDISACLDIPPEALVVVPNGIDTSVFRPRAHDARVREEMGSRDSLPLVGCVARLHEHKDHRTLLYAMAMVRDRSPSTGFTLVLIGGGPERAALEALAGALGLADRVRFLGDRGDVERLMPHLDLLVLSSRTEGLPLVMLEAMACGVPCVATAVGGIPELLSRGGGKLVPPGDPIALADALLAVLSQPEGLARLAGEARRAVTACYDRVAMVNAYQRVLDPDPTGTASGHAACPDKRPA